MHHAPLLTIPADHGFVIVWHTLLLSGRAEDRHGAGETPADFPGNHFKRIWDGWMDGWAGDKAVRTNGVAGRSIQASKAPRGEQPANDSAVLGDAPTVDDAVSLLRTPRAG